MSEELDWAEATLQSITSIQSILRELGSDREGIERVGMVLAGLRIDVIRHGCELSTLRAEVARLTRAADAEKLADNPHLVEAERRIEAVMLSLTSHRAAINVDEAIESLRRARNLIAQTLREDMQKEKRKEA